jgi:hypothetical protein
MHTGITNTHFAIMAGNEGISPQTLLKEYSDYRHWEWGTGKLKKERLIELGLDNIADNL